MSLLRYFCLGIAMPHEGITILAGCLKLKIPWKSWYNSQWVAVVEKLVIVVVPNTTITYNEEKEKQLKHDVKLATLQRLEEARQKLREEEKGTVLLS